MIFASTARATTETNAPCRGRVRVLHRTGRWCAGWRRGSTAAYDLPIDPDPGSVDHVAAVERHYLLLDQGIQLARPTRYAGAPIEGWWYIDLVAVDDTPQGLVVRDMFVDVIATPAGERYDVLDLDDLADALHAGEVSAAECATTLRQAQQLIDRHLLAPELGTDKGAREFPPAPVSYPRVAAHVRHALMSRKEHRVRRAGTSRSQLLLSPRRW